MFSDTSMEVFSDLYNTQGKRNVRNTDRFLYNCGGYALGTYSWYLPYKHHIRGFWPGVNLSRRRMDEITDQCARFMLQDFPTLRIIESVSDLRKDEYAIAFRLSSDGDFHYLKRNRMGLWTHKTGAYPKIWKMPKSKVFGSAWCGRYDGKIVLFAKKYA